MTKKETTVYVVLDTEFAEVIGVYTDLEDAREKRNESPFYDIAVSELSQ
jgi:hypothetical protein